MANQFATWVYAEIQGAPPYIGASPFARQMSYSAQQRMSFPTQGTHFWPTSQGIRAGNNYIYSVIEVFPNGLNQPSQKYGSSDSVATLVTAANA